MTIAVDFDGTIVEHRYPEIGKERPFAIQTLKQLIEDGHKLILWSVREGKLLDEAVEWCAQRGVRFYAVNQDYDEDVKEGNRNFSRKLKVNMFIDDRNVGGLPDWGSSTNSLQKDKVTRISFMKNYTGKNHRRNAHGACSDKLLKKEISNT